MSFVRSGNGIEKIFLRFDELQFEEALTAGVDVHLHKISDPSEHWSFRENK